jgi:hypothetical protein
MNELEQAQLDTALQYGRNCEQRIAAQAAEITAMKKVVDAARTISESTSLDFQEKEVIDILINLDDAIEQLDEMMANSTKN